MASAVLASRNESSWGQSVYSNNLNPNPSHNPKSIPKKKKLHGRYAEDSPAVTQTAPDDAYSFNQRSMEWNDSSNFNHGEYITFNIGTYTRSELIELKKRLVAERERIWRLNDRIDSGKFEPRSRVGGHQLQGKTKKLSGIKRPIPFVSGKDPKRLCQTTSDNGIGNASEIGDAMKMCRLVLTKLLKHKLSWVFNKPVDAVALGLHDYHQIIKRPMDLGTVKSSFAKNLYTSPDDFAADVRLTFNNAMLYNPKGDEVYKMAEQLLARFEELYRPIQKKYEGDQKQRLDPSDELQGSSWSRIPTPEKTKKLKSNSIPAPERTKKLKSNSMPTTQKHEKMQTPVSATNPSSSNPQSLHSPVPTPSPVQAPPMKPAVERTNLGKQPKPKAKDPNKRQMSMEEKHRLSIGLQSLPQEKMPQLVQIVRKRNAHLAQEGDEIELDIEAIDTETVWELDRFVTNWKKLVSKNKRQALMGNNSVAATTSGEDNVFSVSEMTNTVKKTKKGEAGEEDVDIGDEMPMSSFPPVEIEKDGGGHDNNGHATSSSSSSSSSGSDSSSSSESDSGSSSGSDSDADDAQSRGMKSKELSKT